MTNVDWQHPPYRQIRREARTGRHNHLDGRPHFGCSGCIEAMRLDQRAAVTRELPDDELTDLIAEWRYGHPDPWTPIGRRERHLAAVARHELWTRRRTT